MKGIKLLSGNEAIARGCLESGIHVFTSYPGTPAEGIFEYLDRIKSKIYKQYSINEKVAFEIAFGASLMNKRALCSMKNAGFNVILDTLTAVSYTGIRGGLVIFVADDPGCHFSVTEQDTRNLTKCLKIPCLEPSNSQECKDMVDYAFNLSEKLELPVIIRSVTSVSHAISQVRLNEIKTVNRKPIFEKHYKWKYRWNPYAPPRPVHDHKILLSKLNEAIKFSESSKFNQLFYRGSKRGVITSGNAFPYVKACKNCDILKLGFAYPIPARLVKEFIKDKDKLFVIEEGDEVIEEQVKLLTSKEILSRKNKYGEITHETTNPLFL